MKRRKLLWTTTIAVVIILLLGIIFGYYYSSKISESLNLLEWRSQEFNSIDNIIHHVQSDVDRVTFHHPVALTHEEQNKLIIETLQTALRSSSFPDYYYTVVVHGNEVIFNEQQVLTSIFGCGAAINYDNCIYEESIQLLGKISLEDPEGYTTHLINGKEYFVFGRDLFSFNSHWHIYFLVEKEQVLATSIEPEENFSWSVVFSIFILFLSIAGLIVFSILRVWESERKYSVIVQNANDLILVCNREGKIVDSNPVAKRVFGRQIIKLKKQNFFSYVVDRSIDIDDLLTIGDREECIELEFKILKRHVVLECFISSIEIKGSPHIFIVARDITERKRLEKRAEVIYALSHKLLNVNTLDDVCSVVVDGVKDLIFFENVAVFMLNKYDQLYLRATNLKDVGFAENISNKKNIIYKAFSTISMQLYTKATKKGIVFLDRRSEVEAALPLIAGGETLGVLYLGSHKRDMLEFFSDKQYSVLSQLRDKHLLVLASEVAIAIKNVLYRNELRNWKDKLDRMVHVRTKELHEANQELRHQDQLKSDLVNVVGHELRTPLTSIRGFTEVLSDTGENMTAEQKDFLHVIKTESERLSELIDDMLDVSKIEAGKLDLRPSRFDLIALLRQCTLCHQAEEKGIKIKFSFAQESVEVFADRDRMQQVVLNLVSNAIKFTEKGGKITVGASLAKNKRVKVYIKDTGVGISEKDLPHLFEKFYQAENHLRRSAGGSGLGLNISKKIVELHRGNISVTSKQGRGSEFSFVIPLEFKEAEKEGEQFATSIVDKYY